MDDRPTSTAIISSLPEAVKAEPPNAGSAEFLNANGKRTYSQGLPPLTDSAMQDPLSGNTLLQQQGQTSQGFSHSIQPGRSDMPYPSQAGPSQTTRMSRILPAGADMVRVALQGPNAKGTRPTTGFPARPLYPPQVMYNDVSQKLPPGGVATGGVTLPPNPVPQLGTQYGPHLQLMTSDPNGVTLQPRPPYPTSALGQPMRFATPLASAPPTLHSQQLPPQNAPPASTAAQPRRIAELPMLAAPPQGWHTMPPEQPEAAAYMQGPPPAASPSLPNALQAPAMLASPPEQGGSTRKGSKKVRETTPSTRKHCNCKNSRCLKLYCECFASGRYCADCNCVSCCNNQENESFRQAAVETILDRNPNAFRPKIQERDGTAMAVTPAWHNKGCNCKKSNCLKKYCECFQASIYCSEMCKCSDCHNYNFALGPKGSGPVFRRPGSGSREGEPSLTTPKDKSYQNPAATAMAECMQEFEKKNGLQDLTTLLLSVAHEEAEKHAAAESLVAGAQGNVAAEGMSSSMATLIDPSGDREEGTELQEERGPETSTSAGVSPDSCSCIENLRDSTQEEVEARVEAAVLRDFGKALAKLVTKVAKRETELEESAKRQARLARQHPPLPVSRQAEAAPHESPPTITHAWQVGHENWGTPPAANGSAQPPQGPYQQAVLQNVEQPGQTNLTASGFEVPQSGGHFLPRPMAFQHQPQSSHMQGQLSGPMPLATLPHSQHMASTAGSPTPPLPSSLPLPTLLNSPPGQRTVTGPHSTPSVLASLLHQNRGDASNALSNRPSPIKQAQNPLPKPLVRESASEPQQ